MEKVIAYLNWELRVECPYCNTDVWLEEHDVDGIYSIPIFNNKWDDLVEEEVCCPHCNEIFLIKEVIY